MEAGVGENVPIDPDPVPERIDVDGDGFTYEEGDCNDQDGDIGPGFTDSCDGKDNDCNGLTDDDIGGRNVCEVAWGFTQTLQLDVLFVVDVSPGMSTYLTRLAQGSDAFLQEVVGEGYDTHIGVVTTDMLHPNHQGRLVAPGGERWIEGLDWTIDKSKVWMGSAILGNDELLWGEEGGRAAVDAAVTVEADGANVGFLRSEAELVIIFASNEDDPSDYPDVPTFLDHLDKAKGSLSQVTVHSIVMESSDPCSGQTSNGSKGVSYMDLADFTSGTTLSICELEYTQYLGTLGQISGNQALESRFELPLPAESPESMVVRVVFPSGSDVYLDYDEGEFALIDGNSTLLLLTDPLPPPGSQIMVDYHQDY
jgi:hypothetical protein